LLQLLLMGGRGKELHIPARTQGKSRMA
jgi:hypothetical protein